MRICCCNAVLAAGLWLGLASAAPGQTGQPSEAIPPWGRELNEPAPLPERAVDAMQDGSVPVSARRPPVWLNVEYLLWWTRNQSAPPLITRGDTSDARPGALDQPYTRLLYGGVANDINFEDRHGGRFTFGVPLDLDGVYEVELSYLFLTARAVGTSFSSPGSPILAQPFFDALNNAYDSSLATYPGLVQGSISVRSTSLLQGAEANGTALAWERGESRVTLLAGLRYLNLHEDLQIASLSTGDPGSAMFAGTNFAVQDRFVTWSDFYGAQVGIAGEWHYRRLQLNLLAKVAVGDTVETSQVSGHTITNFPAPLSVPAGLLALASNSGTFRRNAFAFVPEAGVSLGLRVTEHLTVSAGYTFLYWSEVARPGGQIDLGLNPNLIPTSLTYGAAGGPARPAAGVHGTEFWAQGLNVGLLLRY
jgi:Putative beta barrel porin-7 (BBP7)